MKKECPNADEHNNPAFPSDCSLCKEPNPMEELNKRLITGDFEIEDTSGYGEPIISIDDVSIKQFINDNFIPRSQAISKEEVKLLKQILFNRHPKMATGATPYKEDVILILMKTIEDCEKQINKLLSKEDKE